MKLQTDTDKMKYSEALLSEVKDEINSITPNGRLGIYGSREGLVEVRRVGIANYQLYLSGNVQRTGSMCENRMIHFLLDNIYFID